jgi:enoyl-CoA hydratase/carnithine racemase
MTRVSAPISALEALPIPTIALVHGRCLAGALEVALTCDLIWAAAGTQIGQVEAVIGGFPFAGGTQRLASRIGMARATEMVFGARIYPAEQLAAWGLIGRVVPADALVSEGHAFATQLAMGPTLAHEATKRILRAWRSGGVAAADEITRAEAPGVILSHDLQETLPIPGGALVSQRVRARGASPGCGRRGSGAERRTYLACRPNRVYWSCSLPLPSARGG